MKVKYQIDDNILMEKLSEAYSIPFEELHFIPLGDSAYSYRVDGVHGQRYYLKLFDHHHARQKTNAERLHYYLPLTWQLYHQGLFRNMTYPIQTQQGDFHVTFDEMTLVLFNFIEGETLAEAYPFSRKILEDIAQSVAAIQLVTPALDRRSIRVENFDISYESNLMKCIAMLESTVTINISDEIQRALREQVLPNKEQILVLQQLVCDLREAVRIDSEDMVLSHGDIWGGNLIRHQDELYVIDWENAMIAPRELDLVGYIGKDFDVFFSAYEQHLGQSVTINLDLLRFYSYRHHLRNLTEWLMNILYRNQDTAQNANDLEMIVHHCMNRWNNIEENVQRVDDVLQSKKKSK